ncbi:MAG TPA: helix-turn-helix domain-containing protein [Polyangiaceae bacterium]|nr:helix-turn-helix domain-containing protein [Polyangiaceae bacterium]
MTLFALHGIFPRVLVGYRRALCHRLAVASTSLPANAPRYFTPGQVAAWAGVTSMTVIRWCDAGLLKAVTTPGGHRRIFESSVRDYLLSRGLPIPPEMAGAAPGAAVSRVQLVDATVAGDLGRHLQDVAEVASYGDPYRALVAACSSVPAVFVLDISAPGVDGERLVRALRQEPRTSSMAIVAFGADAAELDAARRAGVTHALARGALDELERIVRAIASPPSSRR